MYDRMKTGRAQLRFAIPRSTTMVLLRHIEIGSNGLPSQNAPYMLSFRIGFHCTWSLSV